MSRKSRTPVTSNCQYAILVPSGDQRKQSRVLNSSSYTQSDVPFIRVRDPSVVSLSGPADPPVAPTSSTYRSLCRTYATRCPSGENFANMSDDGGASGPPSCLSDPLERSSSQ